jgi:hypothetical protein
MNQKEAELAKKYEQQLGNYMENTVKYDSNGNPIANRVDDIFIESKNYEDFKKDMLAGKTNLYEQFCNQSEQLLKLKPGAEKEKLLQKSIDACHLGITPSGALSFAVLVPILIILLFGLGSYLIFNDLFLLIFFVFGAIILINPLMNIPFFFEKKWKLEASKEMVLSIFYVVTYMRHTSNLEKGIQFAADFLTGPLALDLKRVIWNVQTEKYSTIRESLDAYLVQWRATNIEFVEAFHLVEGSLYEGSEDRRLSTLDKSLDVILEGTYENMLHYAQNLKGPVNSLNMLGVILPILGLVILPLAVSFMGNVFWYHVSVLYNIGIPLTVFFMGKSILASRPSGYGGSSAEINAYTKEKKKSFLGMDMIVTPFSAALITFVIFMIIGFSPIWIHLFFPNFDISVTMDGGFQFRKGYIENSDYYLLDYHPVVVNEKTIDGGPYGLGASLLSVLVVLGIGLSLGVYFRMLSEDLVSIRDESNKLELEFSSALFQIGNRLSDGYPAEIIFDKVGDLMEGTVSGDFFRTVGSNISRLGLSVKDALFSPRVGAIQQYPSNLVKSSMKVLIQSITKGPIIAASAMNNVARYVKEIHRVNERLKDIMAEIVGSMNSQVKFLSPVISGIVVGITTMISTILSKLSGQMENMAGATGGGGGLMDMLGESTIPTFHFQMVVGIYVVQLIYILTVIKEDIENSGDTVSKHNALGQNLKKSTMLYCIITIIIMFLFTILATMILGSTNPEAI